jgi:hypothetical protein
MEKVEFEFPDEVEEKNLGWEAKLCPLKILLKRRSKTKMILKSLTIHRKKTVAENPWKRPRGSHR